VFSTSMNFFHVCQMKQIVTYTIHHNKAMETDPVLVMANESVAVKVTVMSHEQKGASMRMKVEGASLLPFTHVHLPPLHRLRQRLEPALNALMASPHHLFRVYTRVSEPLVTNLDGVDLSALWRFLESKPTLYTLAYTDEALSTEMCTELNENFSLYKLLLDFNDCAFLLSHGQDPGRDELISIARKIPLAVWRDWFGPICCSVACLCKSTASCGRCKFPLCGDQRCSELHSRLCGNSGECEDESTALLGGTL